MTYRCSVCGYTTKNPERDEKVVRSRGYHWHRGCALILRDGEVGFPSPGKMIPQSIITKGE